MKRKMELLGLKIIKIPSSYTGEFIFDIVAGKGSPAENLFFTSPALRDFLSEHKIQGGTPVGHISYILVQSSPKMPLVFEQATYPFGHDESASNIFMKLKGKWMASELEKKCLTELRKIHKGSKIIIVPYMGIISDSREIQLKKRGMRMARQSYKFADAYRVSLEGMIDAINRKRRLSRHKSRAKTRPLRH